MKIFKADLHIHSCLSPCADLDMSPRAIVEMGIARGMDIIAICDHNSAENVGAAMRAGAERGLFVFPGMEICSREEVHTIALFESEKQALNMQKIVYDHLTGTNRPEVFGDQVVVNELDEIECFNDRMLIGATQLALLDVVKSISRLGGLSIASHIDRPSFSLLGQLGFIPPELDIDALEISPHFKKELIPTLLTGARNFPIVTSSDAHFLNNIGTSYTSFLLESPSLDEIRLAFKGKCGRRVEG